MKKYYISDTHFGHANIIKLNNRPFSDVEEMDNIMIRNWNETVTDEDIVYILGDFCFTKKGLMPDRYINRLNGKKVFILGNHDQIIGKDKNYPGIESVYNYLEIQDTTRKSRYRVILFHYPIAEWNGYFRGSIHLYGHIHNNMKNDAYKVMQSIKGAYNVGADILGFRPRTLEEVIYLNKVFSSQHKNKNRR